jgi:3-dehydroquinate dehydratase/shikimate dehydrogenase
MIIVSITGPTMKEALAQIAGSSPFAEMIELRLDLIREPSLGMVMAATRKPIVATCRPKSLGGGFDGTETERVEILEAASLLGAAFVDVELGTDSAILREFLSRKESRVILSHHEYGRVPDVSRLYARMRAYNAPVLKFAYVAHDSADIRHAVEFLTLARRDKQKAIALAMGEFGEASRVLYKKFGAWATFASAENGENAAPGQIPASVLKKLYRADRISRRTRVYGVVGNPLGQSKGIFLHNPLFQRARVNAVYCRFPTRRIAAFMNHLAPMLDGFSVTIPHKRTIMKNLDRLDRTATAIGAVNTVLRKGGKFMGTNTDAPGALDAIERVTKVAGRRMLILGAGGAARAIAHEAHKRGAAILLTNRSEQRGRKLAREFGVSYVGSGDVAQAARGCDIIVNATPVGMIPNAGASPLPRRLLKKKIVFDVVYNPPMTKLLQDALKAGATIIPGTEMYLNQAALQFELYAGVKPSVAAMRKILGSAR